MGSHNNVFKNNTVFNIYNQEQLFGRDKTAHRPNFLQHVFSHLDCI